MKVTATGGTATVTYTVTVTRSEFLVSNLEQEVSGYDGIYESTLRGAATSFTTGSNPGGYVIGSVRLRIGVIDGTVPDVSIYSDSSGWPGSSVKVLTNPSDIPSMTQAAYDNDDPVVSGRRDFGADNFALDPDTTYWVVIERRSGGSVISVPYTASGDEDAGAAPGWSIGDAASRLSGGTWADAVITDLPNLVGIKGSPVLMLHWSATLDKVLPG